MRFSVSTSNAVLPEPGLETRFSASVLAVEMATIFRGNGIVPSENIPLDAQQPRFAGRRARAQGHDHAMIMLMRTYAWLVPSDACGCVHAAVNGRANALAHSLAVVLVGKRGEMKVVDMCLAVATTADTAHQTTSIALSRSSSPP